MNDCMSVVTTMITTLNQYIVENWQKIIRNSVLDLSREWAVVSLKKFCMHHAPNGIIHAHSVCVHHSCYTTLISWQGCHILIVTQIRDFQFIFMKVKTILIPIANCMQR